MGFIVEVESKNKSNKLSDQQLFAIKHYLNVRADMDEFKSDLRVSYKIGTEIQRLMEGSPKANPRVLINRVIVFFNSFDVDAAKIILFENIPTSLHRELKTTLVITGKAFPSDFLDSELDFEFYNVLAKELI